jgi:FMN phosphatase YigB (HAD superfamily)
MIPVASFDVFDTVLTRAVGSPETVFLLLGRRLHRAGLIACTPQEFAQARIDAEGRAHRDQGDACTLDAIYAELGAALNLTEVESRRLREMENALEAELIRPVPSAVERIQQARAQGQRIVFLSDMYLSSVFIRQQLIRHGIWRDEDRCYVSCECGKSKRSGALFADMLRDAGLLSRRYDLAVHHGNSLEGDIQAARRVGLQAMALMDANPNRYEQLLERHAWATEGLTSTMAGASRLARLNTPVASVREAALRDVAAGVVAPTLAGFALWILYRALERGLKRLYFISRDGQILLEVTRRLAQSLDLPIEMRYLYGSRQAWNPPAIAEAAEEELAWVWDTTDFLSVRSLLARVGLAPQQIGEQLLAAGLKEVDWDRALSADERAALKRLFRASEVQALILKRARQKRQVMLQYLEQEGVLDSDSWGLVDLGWYGSMQNALAAVVADAGKTVPIGLYSGLWKGDVPDRCAANREAYYFDERLGLGFIQAVPDLIALMEAFCAADHGTVIDFTKGGQGGGIAPVLKEARNHRVIDWGLPLIRQTVACFIDHMLLGPENVDPWADVREAMTDVLRAFWLRPSYLEATAWASFPWEDGLGNETYWNQLAKPYSWKDVLKVVYTRKVQYHHRASWFAGSLALSRPAIRLAMTILGFILRKFRSLGHRMQLRPRAVHNPERGTRTRPL